MTAPSDLSVVIELALLTTDRTPEEDAALARVAAVAGLGDLVSGTQAPGGDSSVTERGLGVDSCIGFVVRMATWSRSTSPTNLT